LEKELGDAMGSFDVDEAAAPELAEGDRQPFRQMTFTVHDEQFEEIERALARAKELGGGESLVNENSNGNALAFVCGRFNGGAG
jgi:ParB family transcriptional regulator, chromosome partitioning protein